MTGRDLCTDIELAEARVQADEEHVSRLEQLIQDFERERMPSFAEHARLLLKQFVEMRALHVAERDHLRRQLGRMQG